MASGRRVSTHAGQRRHPLTASERCIEPSGPRRYTAAPSSHRPMPDSVRLSNRVAELAGCSRGDAELLIRNGWVSVDGRVIESPQHRVTIEQVTIAADARKEPVEPATIVLHKPAGFDTIRGPRPAADLVTPGTRWQHD